ncbi:uncharacterized protein ACR2FA_011630 [Aphomia sociella]
MNKILICLICFCLSVTDITADEELSDYLSKDEGILSIVGKDDSKKSDKGKHLLGEDSTEGETPMDYLNCTVFPVNFMRCLFMNTRTSLLPGWKTVISDVSIPSIPPKGYDIEQAQNKIGGALEEWFQKMLKIMTP